MPYLDTSILISALVEEPRSRDADEVLTYPGETIWISDWSMTEAASALSLKLRSNSIDEPTRRAARRHLEMLGRESLNQVSVEPSDFRRAAALCDHHALKLRAGDALHLAIAERIGVELYTFDEDRAAAGVTLGIATRLI